MSDLPARLQAHIDSTDMDPETRMLLEEAATKILHLESTNANAYSVLRDVAYCRSLTSLPRKITGMRRYGFGGIDNLHAWMTAVGERLRVLVGASPQPATLRPVRSAESAELG
jgi:hypothetical protein